MTDLSHLKSMPDLRVEVDRVDRALIALLAERATLIDRAAEIKMEAGIAARLPDRVAQVLANVRGHAQAEGLDPDLAEALWRLMIDWSIAREEAAMGGNAKG